MENKDEVKKEVAPIVEKEKKETAKPQKEKIVLEDAKPKIKEEKVEKKEKTHSTSTFKMAFNMLKSDNNSHGALNIAILGFVLSLFVLLVTLTVKAQTGFIMVALIMLIAYMIVIAILALIVNFIALMLTKNKLKQTSSLIGFIVSIVSILTVVASVLIIYLT